VSMPHITVCVCTYKRPALLARLLDALATQATDGAFSYSLVVADNDEQASAAEIVAAFEASSGIETAYVVESRRNIALARNAAVALATGEYVATIDDDEFPGERWLSRMGSAWCLGEDHLYANSDSLTDPHRPTGVATPLDWLRVAGEAFCILDWDARDVRELVAVDAIRCTNRILEKTLIDAISKPVRLPRILRTEALAHVA